MIIEIFNTFLEGTVGMALALIENVPAFKKIVNYKEAMLSLVLGVPSFVISAVITESKIYSALKAK